MSGVGTYDPNGTLIGSYWIPDYVDDPTGRTIQPGLQNPNVQINGNLGVTGTITGSIVAGPATELDTDASPVIINTNHPTASGQSLISTSSTNATWQAPAAVSLTTGVSGVLPIANGGTNQSTVGANGTVLTSNGTTTAYVAQSTLTAGNATLAANVSGSTLGILIQSTSNTTTPTSGALGTVLVGTGAGVAPIFAEITTPSITRILTGATTYTPPTSCSFIFVVITGGGGGGGGGYNSAGLGGGGGGGSGGMIYATYLANQTFSYSIGTGGSGGNSGAGGTNGSAGNNTTFTSAGPLVDTAAGGSGGAAGTTQRGGTGGVGGSVTVNSAKIVYSSRGGTGIPGFINQTTSGNSFGGAGGGNLAANPAQGGLGGNGDAGVANGGGGGGGGGGGTPGNGGAGGNGSLSIIEFYA